VRTDARSYSGVGSLEALFRGVMEMFHWDCGEDPGAESVFVLCLHFLV
jgi:hypothetical protein